MKKICYIILLVISACTMGCRSNELNIEIQAINDVLDSILLKESVSNPYINATVLLPPPPINKISQEGEFNYTKSDIDSFKLKETKEFDSKIFVIHIPPNLLSLYDTLKQNDWLYKNESIGKEYEEIIKSPDMKNKVGIDFEPKILKNLWKYKLIETTEEYTFNDKFYFLNLNLSRVAFNKDQTKGLFFVEVVNQGKNGYWSLILIEKNIKKNKWEFKEGTYYR